MKRWLLKMQAWVGAQAWWMTLLGLAIAVAQAIAQWGELFVFEFGIVQWLVLAFAVGIVWLKELQTRELIAMNKQLTTHLLDCHREGLERVIADMGSGKVADPLPTYAHLQRYLDKLSELRGDDNAASDELLAGLHELVKRNLRHP